MLFFLLLFLPVGEPRFRAHVSDLLSAMRDLDECPWSLAVDQYMTYLECDFSEPYAQLVYTAASDYLDMEYGEEPF